MTRSAVQAARVFLDQKTNRPGYCLQEVRQAYGIPAKYGDAATAWRYAIGKHKDDRTPPLGAPVFFTGGSEGHGHVAIFIHYRARSTDVGGAGIMGTASLEWFESHWNMEYVGWAEGFNSVRIPGLPPPAPAPIVLKDLRYGVMHSDSVKRLQARLNAHFNLDIPRTGNYLDQTDYAVRQCQRQHGFGSDPVQQSYVGPKQAHHLHLI